MPLGEFIAEIGLRIVFEIVFYGVAYWTGFIALKILSFGILNLAPLMTIEEKNRSKKRKKEIDWSIWLHRPMQGKALKAETTCLVGILCWIAVGFGVYHATRDIEKTANKTSLLTPDPPPVPDVMPATTSTRSPSLAPGEAWEDLT